MDIEWTPGPDDKPPDEHHIHTEYMAGLVAHYCNLLLDRGLSEYIVAELGKEWIARSFITED